MRQVHERAYRRATFGVRIRFIKLPAGNEAFPFDLSRFRVGETYEVGPRLAEYLMACGYAQPVDNQPALDTAADRPRNS